MEAFHSDMENDEPTGMTIKRKKHKLSRCLYCAKNNLKKGKIYKDNEGRQLQIIEAPNGPGPIDMEVKTLRGIASICNDLSLTALN